MIGFLNFPGLKRVSTGFSDVLIFDLTAPGKSMASVELASGVPLGVGI
jgi:hypothetical protein